MLHTDGYILWFFSFVVGYTPFLRATSRDAKRVLAIANVRRLSVCLSRRHDAVPIQAQVW